VREARPADPHGVGGQRDGGRDAGRRAAQGVRAHDAAQPRRRAGRGCRPGRPCMPMQRRRAARRTRARPPRRRRGERRACHTQGAAHDRCDVASAGVPERPAAPKGCDKFPAYSQRLLSRRSTAPRSVRVGHRAEAACGHTATRAPLRVRPSLVAADPRPLAPLPALHPAQHPSHLRG
jgi:hypothetical protein